MTRTWRLPLLALAAVTAACALSAPAGAQFWERAPRHRDHFPFSFFGGGGGGYGSGMYNPFGQAQRPQESIRPPPPRKVETQPASTVVIIGDALADWLGYGLEEALAETPEIGIVRKIRPTSGLVRYEGKSDAPDWSQAIKETLATEKPSAIIVMLGLNDRLPLRERAPVARGASKGGEQKGAEQKSGEQPGQSAAQAAPSAAQPAGQGATNAQPAQEQNAAESPADQQSVPANEAQRGAATGTSYDFHTDKWAELYSKRIDDMIAALKAKGVPVIWVGLPAIRGTRSTSDMLYLDELFRARAEKAGITYVDVWDGFVDEQGRFAQQGPDFEGQIRRLRTGDGIHFTKAGAIKLAHYVEHDLRRVLSNRLAPMAMPAPDEQSPKTPGGRPAIGPVVPLTATSGGEGGDLVGAGNTPPPPKADPVALHVFSRGDALTPPAGRADNFAWPRTDATANAAAAPEAVPPAPAIAAPIAPGPAAPAPAAKASGGKADVKKLEPKAQGTPSAAPEAPPARPRRSRADLDGAPRPPVAIGPSNYR